MGPDAKCIFDIVLHGWGAIDSSPRKAMEDPNRRQRPYYPIISPCKESECRQTNTVGVDQLCLGRWE